MLRSVQWDRTREGAEGRPPRATWRAGIAHGWTEGGGHRGERFMAATVIASSVRALGSASAMASP